MWGKGPMRGELNQAWGSLVLSLIKGTPGGFEGNTHDETGLSAKYIEVILCRSSRLVMSSESKMCKLVKQVHFAKFEKQHLTHVIFPGFGLSVIFLLVYSDCAALRLTV